MVVLLRALRLRRDAVANAEILDLIQNSKFKIDHSKFRNLCAALVGEAVFL